jgi:hypothetical protein
MSTRRNRRVLDDRRARGRRTVTLVPTPFLFAAFPFFRDGAVRRPVALVPVPFLVRALPFLVAISPR